jgi:cytochrome c6
MQIEGARSTRSIREIKPMGWQRWVMVGLAVVLFWAVPYRSSVGAATLAGSQLFEQQCAGCHVNGGNIVRRNQTLKLKALQKNQVDTVEAIAALITNGKGNLMSAYGDRLSAEEIATLASYVLEQAQHDWAKG